MTAATKKAGSVKAGRQLIAGTDFKFVEAGVALPCPFCGGDELRYREFSHGVWIACTTCAASGPYVDRDDEPEAKEPHAVASWNQRHARSTDHIPPVIT